MKKLHLNKNFPTAVFIVEKGNNLYVYHQNPSSVQGKINQILDEMMFPYSLIQKETGRMEPRPGEWNQ